MKVESCEEAKNNEKRLGDAERPLREKAYCSENPPGVSIRARFTTLVESRNQRYPRNRWMNHEP